MDDRPTSDDTAPTACDGDGTTAPSQVKPPDPSDDPANRQRRRRKPPTPEERERLDMKAADKREYRALIKNDGAVLRSVPVRNINGLIEALMELGWLPESKSEDRKAIAAAVGGLLDDLVASRSR